MPSRITEDSWLAKAQGASSFCSGCGTAELARALMEKSINESEAVPFHVHVPTVSVWDPLPLNW